MAIQTNVAGVVREVLLSDTPITRVAGVAREVLVKDQAGATTRVAGVVREVLVSTKVVTQLAGVVREVLLQDFPIAAPVWRPWLHHEFALDELPDWLPVLIRARNARGVPGKKLRPYLWINL